MKDGSNAKDKRQSLASTSNQIERFKDAARQLEADECEAAFDEKLKNLSEQKPKPVKKG